MLALHRLLLTCALATKSMGSPRRRNAVAPRALLLVLACALAAALLLPCPPLRVAQARRKGISYSGFGRHGHGRGDWDSSPDSEGDGDEATGIMTEVPAPRKSHDEKIPSLTASASPLPQLSRSGAPGLDTVPTQALPRECSGRLCLDLDRLSAVLSRYPKAGEAEARVRSWGPKLDPSYDPRGKDWSSVVATCRAMFKHEKRMGAFFIRAAFHDSLPVDVTNCPGPNCGGADSSLLLTLDELVRPESIDDNLALIASRAAKKIASFFDISVADTLAVCAAVAPEVLSNGRITILGPNGVANFPVGRLDSLVPAPPGQLPSPSAGLEEFVNFWTDRGFTVQEGVALLGSHALLHGQGCFNGPTSHDYCNPATHQDCSNVRMFRWDNHYYQDICSPTLEVRPVDLLEDPPEPAETPVLGMTDPEFEAEARLETCKFTSKEGRTAALNQLKLRRSGRIPQEIRPLERITAKWINRNCTQGAVYGVPTANCPHPNVWPYTGNDALLGQACQGYGTSQNYTLVRSAARSFLNQAAWDLSFRSAYIKMVSSTFFASFSPAAGKGYRISGAECASGFHLEAACAQQLAGPATKETRTLYSGGYTSDSVADKCAACTQGASCRKDQCYECVRRFNERNRSGNDHGNGWELLDWGRRGEWHRRVGRLVETRTSGLGPAWDQPEGRLDGSSITAPLNGGSCCGCATTFRDHRYNDADGKVYNIPCAVRLPEAIMPIVTLMPPQPLPTVGFIPVPERPLLNSTFNDAVAEPGVLNGSLRSPPVTPYADPSKVCPASNGISVRVEGFPSSPFVWTPFVLPFQTPPPAQKASSYCKPGTTICLDAYEVDVYPIAANLTCPKGPTFLLSYNGSSPGPTFRVPVGRQTLVRYNNRLTVERLAGTPFGTYHPCDDTTPDRQGRPISTHLHGEASLAPYDGWAEDSSCGGETKDYYYPSRRPGFSWYHDHQLEITSENCYYGLSGMYIMHEKAADGGCGEPWNLDNIPDTEMQFDDAVLDDNCQLLYDRSGPHKDNLYGDINLVNGIPWPVMTVEPRWQRFRWLVSPVSRPYKFRIVDGDTGDDVSGKVCHVIAGDGGFRRLPTPFPAAGLFMGVAERYEVVCDFTNYAGHTFYLWNIQDKDRMKAVPFFCHSHLVAKIQVQPCPADSKNGVCAPPGSEFKVDVAFRSQLDAVVNDTEYEKALQMARNKECTRCFRFGRRNGHWVINGETWHSARVAADDVGQNTWEVWCLEAGGGWFHPIHIHLVDFYVLTRNHKESLVHEYERLTPKDTVQLDPGSHVAILARFGPHRGEYMFHCHNLVHEDDSMMRSYLVMNSTAGRNANSSLPLQSNPTLIRNLDIVYDLYNDPVNPFFGAQPSSDFAPLRNTNDPRVQEALSFGIERGIYRIFYPGGANNESPLLRDPTINPWLVSLPDQPRCPAP